MHNLTWESRREAYHEIIPKRDTRKDMILSVLRQHESGMTAEEITDYLFHAGAIHSVDRNFVKPRLTEMRKDGMVQAVDRRLSPTTGRRTTVWQATKS